MKLVSIDLETTGLEPQWHQILQVGMVVFDPERLCPVSEEREGVSECWTYEAIVHHDEVHGEPRALQMNAWLLDHITHGYGKPWEEVSRDIDGIIADQFEGERPHLLGFNAWFDAEFLKANGLDLFHHRRIELGSLLMGPDGVPARSSSVVSSFAGRPLTHDALQDALDNVAAYMYWYRRQR